MQRAEVRFIVLWYYSLMDLYGNAAFTEGSSGGRTLYTCPVFRLYWERTEGVGDGRTGTGYYGREQGSCMVLARLYLNAGSFIPVLPVAVDTQKGDTAVNNGIICVRRELQSGDWGLFTYQMLFLADNNRWGTVWKHFSDTLWRGYKSWWMNFLVLAI